MKTLMVGTSVVRPFSLSVALCLDGGGQGYFFSHLWEGRRHWVCEDGTPFCKVGCNMLRESNACKLNTIAVLKKIGKVKWGF